MPELQGSGAFRGQGYREMGGRAVPDRAFHPDLAPVHLHDLLNDREAEAGPGNRLRGTAADTAETLKHVADLVLWDADAGVGDAHQGELPLDPARKRDRPTLRRVLDRVVDQVADDLDQPVAVARDDGQARVEVGLELDTDGGGCGARDRLHQDVVDVHVRRAQRHSAGLHPVEVEHVADQAVHAVRVIEYVAAVGAHLVRLEPSVADQLAETLDAGQRGAELVAHDAEELALGAVDLLEVDVGIPLRLERLRQLVRGLAHRGDVLDHHQHMLGPAARVGDGRRGQLQPQPLAGARRRADLDARPVGDAGEERRLVLAGGGLVVGAKQVGPGARAHRLLVVLEHEEERRVGFQELASAADPCDADRRAFIDGAVVRLAPAQRLRGLRPSDELADLDPGGRQHGHLVVAQAADPVRGQLDDADRLPAVYDGERDDRAQRRRAQSRDALVVRRALEVFLRREHPRLPHATDQAGAGRDGHTAACVQERIQRRSGSVPRVAHVHGLAVGVSRPVLSYVPVEMAAEGAQELRHRRLEPWRRDDDLAHGRDGVPERARARTGRYVGKLDQQ